MVGEKILSKFPVFKNGIEYEVCIYDDDLFDYLWHVKLYKRKEYRLFGLNITKKILCYGKTFGLEKHEHTFGNIEYLDNVDFIYMANAIINEYEEWLAKENEYNSKLDKAINEFNNWDGICR